ncbi:predicted protein [Nematostella vectensis]|uniref:Peptidase S1 domain-containing protein n=1 Tax=Nematostella vectensis TaxID=45351 RepID=A7SGX1_NEMVE|nr:predicted protein [Nematostella vectensis]|eukprot:XP_001629147.1 predicted protein [Nematostella vectensis]
MSLSPLNSGFSLVIGGVNAQSGAWPWQIALERSGSFICGGSLVSPTWVVTAAHCIAGSSHTPSYKVVTGEHIRNSPEGTEQTHDVKRIITHPTYNSPQLSNDIALIELSSPVPLSDRVNPVCLPPQGHQVSVGSKCFITGWGKIRHPGGSHHILQQAMMPPLSQDACKKKVQQAGFGIQITDSMVCAGVPGSLDQGGIDTCQGDSGGPMVCESRGRFYIHGATSWGYGCAQPGKFGVYAHVKNLVAWVRSEMARN